jgi:hypothetical protein
MYIITFEIVNKRKNQKYHTVGTFSKWKNRRNRDKIDTVNTHAHDCSLSWMVQATSVKSDGIILVL